MCLGSSAYAVIKEWYNGTIHETIGNPIFSKLLDIFGANVFNAHRLRNWHHSRMGVETFEIV